MTQPPSPPSRLGELVARANERLGGVEIERMRGDNLAVTLCTHFEDAEGEQDENGWTEAATAGCDETLQAIRDHYAPAFKALLDCISSLEGALEWISKRWSYPPEELANRASQALSGPEEGDRG